MPKTLICLFALMAVFPLCAQELDQGCWVGKMAWRDEYASNDIATLRAYAEQGNPFAQYNLGVRYYNGQGVEQSYAEAAKWWRKAAEQGNALAQYNLGLRYERGQGVEQSYAEAAKWYRKAAEQGDEDAKKALQRLEQERMGN